MEKIVSSFFPLYTNHSFSETLIVAEPAESIEPLFTKEDIIAYLAEAVFQVKTPQTDVCGFSGVCTSSICHLALR